jgi:FkbM family methyltransferase
MMALPNATGRGELRGVGSLDACWPFRLAQTLSALAPRGKGALPRFIGRLTRPWVHHAFRTRHGALIPLVPEVLDVFVAMAAQGNSYDYWVFRVANALLEPGGVFYDIGANVGYMTVEVAQLRRADDIHVYAFEPLPRLAEAVRGAITLNDLDNVILTQAAVGESCGRLPFTRRSNSFVGSVATDGAGMDVAALTLDAAVYERGYRPPDVMKIDVEGYEYPVLAGGQRVLADYQPAVVFEISPGTLQYGHSPGQLVEMLCRAGAYRFYSVKGSPLTHQQISGMAESHGDIVAIPPARQARFDWFAAQHAAGRIDAYWGFNESASS